MKHGIIKLVSKTEQVLRTRQYWGINHRREIIDLWRRQYGQRFHECFIDLTPEVNDFAVREDGRNMRYKKYKKPTPRRILKIKNSIC